MLIKATKDMFAKYAVFKGRASRADYWWAVLGVFILTIIISIIAALIFGTPSFEGLFYKRIYNRFTYLVINIINTRYCT